MIAKMVLPPEGFATDIAREGSLIGVSALVNEQVVGFGEMTFAVLADVFFFRPVKE